MPDANWPAPGQFSNLMNHLPLGVVYHDASGKITYANPAAERMLGLSLDELQGRQAAGALWQVIHEDGSPFPGEEHPVMVALRTGRPVDQVVMGVFQPDLEQTIWLLVHAVPEFQPGAVQPFQVFTTLVDISERMRVEAELHRVMDRYQLIAEKSSDVVWVLDLQDGRFTYVSPSVEKLRGYTPEEVLKQPMSEALTLESAEIVRRRLEVNIPHVLAGELIADAPIELDQPCKDGSIVPTEVTTNIVMKDGRLTVIGITRDIRERKKAEALVREAQTNLELAQDVSGMGSWELNDPAGPPVWSRQMFSLFGFDPEPGTPSQEAFLARIHPDDRAALLEVQSRALVDHQPGRLIYRVCLPDAEQRTYESVLKPLLDPLTGRWRMSGTAIDITDRHLAATRLQESEQTLRAILNATLESVFLIDLSGIVLQANAYGCQRLGRSVEETLGQNLYDLIPPEVGARRRAEVERVLETGGPVAFEDQRGSRYLLNSVYPLFDSQGKVDRLAIYGRDITDRVLAGQRLREESEKLRQTNERFEQLAGNIDEFFWVMNRDKEDPSLQIEYFSPAFEKIYGLGRERIEETKELFRRRIHVDDWPLMQQAQANELAGAPTNLEYRYWHPDGGLRWIWERSSPVRDAAGRLLRTVGVSSDITANKQAQLALAASEEKYRRLSEELEQRVRDRTAQLQDLYDNAPSGYHTTDRSGVVRMINRTELTWLGYTREEVVDRLGIWDLLSEASRARYTAVLEAAHGELRDLELELVRKDGSQLPALVNASPVYDADGRYVADRMMLVDITRRKQVEDALRESERWLRASRDELSAANAELEKASKLKDEFLASMSHELRTPLTGILGLAEALQLQTYGALSEKQLAALRNIEGSGRHLLDLINDILDLSKIEAGRLDLQLQPCALGEICQASLQLTKGMAHQKHLRVSFTSQPVSALVQADPRRLKQMLVNLLSNAVKFTPEGGALGLEVVGKEAARLIHLCVWDHGIGIHEENLGKLFKPFTQLDSSLARQHSGTGLGLSMVAKLAELHGGSVSVESVFGQGSRFTISLPWSGDDSQPPRPAEAVREIPVAAGMAKARVLFADDDEVILTSMTDFLQVQGYDVVKARSGKELAALAGPTRPDIILTDIQMPGMDGMTAIRQIRTCGDAHLAEVPIVAITALAMPGDEEMCLRAGANRYISKPVSLGRLALIVRELLTH
ncbi:MAG: PAS domain S-box protein [Chloroflexota bacterium]